MTSESDPRESGIWLATVAFKPTNLSALYSAAAYRLPMVAECLVGNIEE
jgi:hypothetical protein